MSNLTKQQCSICGSPDHTHLHCYGMQAQGAISSNRKMVPTFEGRLYYPEGSLVGNWVRRAEVDALLDDIERLTRQRDSFEHQVDLKNEGLREQRHEIERLREENQSLRNLAENLRPGPISQALQDSPDYSGQTIERLRAALERYGRHSHPNCHDLTLKADGSFGPRNGCLCGLDATLSGDSSAPETSSTPSAAAAASRPHYEATVAVGVEAIHRVCHELSGTCVMILKDHHEVCTPGNCAAMRVALQGSPEETTENPGAGAPGGVGVIDLAARSVRDSIAPNMHCPVCDRWFWADKFDGHKCSVVKASGEPIYECCNESCLWRGLESETVHPKHEPSRFLCPECHEVVELV